MKNYLSIKYKLIFILTLTVIVTLLGYYLLATNLFEEDKIAYVYSTILGHVSNREHEFDNVIRYQRETLDDYAQLIRMGNHQSLLKILEGKKDILFFSCNKYGFKYGDEEKIKNISNNSLSGVMFDIQNKFVLIRKEFFKDDKCEILFKAAQLFDTSERVENRISVFIPKFNTSISESNLVKEIRKKIVDKKLHSGVKEISDNNVLYLLSFTQVNNDLYYVSGIPKNNAISGIIELKEKSFYYFLALVSVVGFFSIIIANKFSLPILELTEKVLLFGEGKLKVRSKVNTRDELGQMAQVFNEMATKISNLVEEVRVYSTQLEGLVKQRTAALKKALGLQKAMINSLDQGFFIINNKLLIMETYSKSAQKIFGNELEKKSIEQVLKFKQFDEASTKILFKSMFAENMPFESLTDLTPKITHTKEGRIIYLEYEPVRNKEEKIIGIVVISTDKTESIRLEHESEIDKNKVSMILKIVNNQYAFSKFLGEVKSYIQDISSLSSQVVSFQEVFRFAHTMKGCFLLFHMGPLALTIHDIEDEIKSLDVNEDFYPIAMRLCSIIDEDLSSMALEYPFLFGGKNWKESKPLKSFLESDLIKLIVEVKENKDLNLEQFLIENLLYVSFNEVIRPLKEDVLLHAENVGKKIRLFEVKGGDLKINPSDFSIHLQYMLHLTRNSIDHGIETPEERISNGKEEGGHILIELKKPSEMFYSLSLSDDGKGLNEKILRDKAVSVGIDVSNFEGEKAYQLIFQPGFSTAVIETETSGRGIGMSAIKKYIDDLKGEIDIETIPGKSLKISLLIPVKCGEAYIC